MGSTRTFSCPSTKDPATGIGGTLPGKSPSGRHVRDLLPDSFALGRSESEWLLTLLSADELRYIFEGPTHGETQN